MVEWTPKWILPNLEGQKRKEAIQGYLFLLPWIIGFIVFLVIPLGMAAYTAFTRWVLIDPTSKGGISRHTKGNYQKNDKSNNPRQKTQITLNCFFTFLPL